MRGYPDYDYDYDGDGLQSWEERLLGTDPYDYDGDTDDDGMDDGFEFIYQFDPLSSADGPLDADGDQLSNAWEAALGLNPRLTDSNGNGINDANEDRDFDGLSNLAELQTHGTDPSQPDTDLDGLFDGWEIANGFNPLIDNTTDGNPSNDPGADPDGDGLTNTQEADYGTSASNSDTDADGVSDGDEVNQGSNPNDPNDSSPPPNGTIPFNITFGDHSGSHSEKYQIRMEPQEGDTQVRQRTNRTYGQVQTDTIRLPKGAKYRSRSDTSQLILITTVNRTRISTTLWRWTHQTTVWFSRIRMGLQECMMRATPSSPKARTRLSTSRCSR